MEDVLLDMVLEDQLSGVGGNDPNDNNIDHDLHDEADGEMSEDDRVGRILELAREQWHKDGEIEIDDDSEGNTSEGDQNGAYARAWLWVSFAGTDLDKNAPNEEADDDGE